MKNAIFAIAAASSLMFATAAYSGNGPADHADAWHGFGSGHQGNNAPGDTAADRHNFQDAEAGKSGKVPAADVKSVK